MRFPFHRRGAITVYFAIFGIALVALFSLMLDFGRVRLVHHQLQAAADASALAAARLVQSDQLAARTAAIDIASSNLAEMKPVHLRSNDNNSATGDIVFGLFDTKSKSFTATTQSPNSVKINARRTQDSPDGALKLIFGSFWHTPMSDVTATAIALTSDPAPPGLILLDLTADKELNMSGSASVHVIRGSVQIDSSSDDAINMTGGSQVDAIALNAVGSQNLSTSRYTGNYKKAAPCLQDPFKEMSMPSMKSPTPDEFGPVVVNGNQHQDLRPGHYTGGINANGNSSLTMARGTYFIDGGLLITGGASLDASAGVLLYINSGRVTLTGGGETTIKPLADLSNYSDITLLMGRDNDSDVTLTGGSNLRVYGITYAPLSHLELTGSGDLRGFKLVIGSTAELTGSGDITIDPGGDGQFTPPALVN